MKSKPPLIYAVGILLAGLLSLLLGGCAATQVALEHKDLQVQTKMSATVFLDVENRAEKTIFLDVRNTSDKTLEIRLPIESRLLASGYTIAPSAKDAFYILQVNLLQVGVANRGRFHRLLQASPGS